MASKEKEKKGERKERWQNSAARVDTHDERRTHSKELQEARQPEPRKLGAREASLVGCRGQTWEGLECILKATGSHRKLLS